jgi:hypothetical protein
MDINRALQSDGVDVEIRHLLSLVPHHRRSDITYQGYHCCDRSSIKAPILEDATSGHFVLCNNKESGCFTEPIDFFAAMEGLIPCKFLWKEYTRTG